MASPRVRDDITAVELDGETILFDPGTSMIYRLDGLSACVWSLLDGSTSLEDLVLDLAHVFDESPEVVGADVIRFIEDLRGKSLLVPWT